MYTDHTRILCKLYVQILFWLNVTQVDGTWSRQEWFKQYFLLSLDPFWPCPSFPFISSAVSFPSSRPVRLFLCFLYDRCFRMKRNIWQLWGCLFTLSFSSVLPPLFFHPCFCVELVTDVDPDFQPHKYMFKELKIQICTIILLRLVKLCV